MARLTVQRKYFLYGRRMRVGGCLEYCFYCRRDAGKGNPSFEERLDGDFIGGVERDAGKRLRFGRFIGEAKAGKALEVGWLEVEVAEGGSYQR